MPRGRMRGWITRGLWRCAVGLALAASTGDLAQAQVLLPSRVESAATLPAGSFEAILGATYLEDQRFPAFTGSGALQSQQVLAGPEMGLRAAAGDWAEIHLTFEMLSLRETERGGHMRRNVFGAGDARVSTKVRLVREAGLHPGFGVRFGTKLPNANKNNRLGTDQTDFGIEGLLSKDVGVATAHLNLGIQLLGNPGPMLGAPERKGFGQDDLLSFGGALMSAPLGALGQGFGIVRAIADVTGQAGSHADNNRVAGRLGLQVRRDAFTAYAGVSAGLVTASENFGLCGGVIYTFDLDCLLAEPD